MVSIVDRRDAGVLVGGKGYKITSADATPRKAVINFIHTRR